MFILSTFKALSRAKVYTYKYYLHLSVIWDLYYSAADSDDIYFYIILNMCKIFWIVSWNFIKFSHEFFCVFVLCDWFIENVFLFVSSFSVKSVFNSFLHKNHCCFSTFVRFIGLCLIYYTFLVFTYVDIRVRIITSLPFFGNLYVALPLLLPICHLLFFKKTTLF